MNTMNRMIWPLLAAAAMLLAGCATTSYQHKAGLQYQSGDAGNKGYRHVEAKQFIEFCVELDNQDDRAKYLKNPAAMPSDLRPHIDPALWDPTPIYDSRLAVAKDVVDFQAKGADAKSSHWGKLYEAILKAGKFQPGQKIEVGDIFNNPDLNGFGPWQNAWLLYKGRGDFAGAYAIAVRGTVFSNQPSAVEDAIFQPVIAEQFISKAVQFSDYGDAMLHSGFAHATFTTMLDDRYGVLRVLNDNKVPAGSRLYIVGHSQGAAMATLVHAFMHYGLRNDEMSDKPAFGLKGMRYKLKSYVFAQPKPGNYAFASDFTRITQGTDSAIVINNDIDPVPQVPLTIQALSDLDNDFIGKAKPVRALDTLGGLGAGIRSVLAAIAEPLTKKSAEGYGYFYRYEDIRPLGEDKVGNSWNFVPAGHVIMVYGTASHPDDLFFQHHATTYRKLIAEQLADGY